MSRPLPVSHQLVLAIARQLTDAINHDLGSPQGPRFELGPRAMSIVAELVGAAQGHRGLPCSNS